MQASAVLESFPTNVNLTELKALIARLADLLGLAVVDRVMPNPRPAPPRKPTKTEPKKGTKKEAVIAFLEGNPDASVSEVAHAVGCSRSTASTVRKAFKHRTPNTEPNSVNECSVPTPNTEYRTEETRVSSPPLRLSPSPLNKQTNKQNNHLGDPVVLEAEDRTGDYTVQSPNTEHPRSNTEHRTPGLFANTEVTLRPGHVLVTLKDGAKAAVNVPDLSASLSSELGEPDDKVLRDSICRQVDYLDTEPSERMPHVGAIIRRVKNKLRSDRDVAYRKEQRRRRAPQAPKPKRDDSSLIVRNPFTRELVDLGPPPPPMSTIDTSKIDPVIANKPSQLAPAWLVGE